MSIFVEKLVGGLSQVAAAGSGKGGVPFAIEGTTANPHFVPDVGGMVGGVAQNAMGVGKNVVKQNPANALGGLLGSKKQ